MQRVYGKMTHLYKAGVVKRTIVVWIAFQAILWIVFGITYFANPDSWRGIYEASHAVPSSDSLLRTFLFIIGNNLTLFLLIALGNIFVRFGPLTPGLLILALQGVMIGRVAGANSFEFPFASVWDANIRYLKVGLWETTAYALICAVTLTKSLNIADTFPAKQWTETRKLKDIDFSVAEKIVVLISVLMLITAAYIEAVLVIGS
jgi:uncharacterized membrane protein SpoIIM required for sporulation